MARRAAHLEENVGGERRVDAAVKDFGVGERELRVRRRVRPCEARRLAEVVGGSAEIPNVARALAAYVQVVRLRADVRHAVERALFLRFQLAENLRRDLRRHVLLDEHHVRGVVGQRAIHQRAACHAVVQREPHGAAADALGHATGEHVGGAEAVGHRAGGERVDDDEASLGAPADHQNARDRASDAVRDRVGDSAGQLAVGVGRIGREDRDGERTRDPLRKVQELGPFDVARLGERRDSLRLGCAGNERAGDERRGEYHAGLRPGPHHSWGARALGAKTARAVSRAVIVTDIDPNARFPVPSHRHDVLAGRGSQDDRRLAAENSVDEHGHVLAAVGRNGHESRARKARSDGVSRERRPLVARRRSDRAGVDGDTRGAVAARGARLGRALLNARTSSRLSDRRFASSQARPDRWEEDPSGKDRTYDPVPRPDPVAAFPRRHACFPAPPRCRPRASIASNPDSASSAALLGSTLGPVKLPPGTNMVLSVKATCHQWTAVFWTSGRMPAASMMSAASGARIQTAERRLTSLWSTRASCSDGVPSSAVPVSPAMKSLMLS